MKPILTLFIAFAIAILFTTCHDDDAPSKVAPEIFTVNPPQGCIADLPLITLVGTGFNGAKNVRFGNLTLSDGQFVVNATGDELYIQAGELSGLSVGNYSISVESSGGVSGAIAFSVNEVCAPMLTGMAPSMAMAGETIVISGKYFEQPDLRVCFTDANQSTTLVATILASSETELSVVVPNGCISGNVAVKNTLGTSNTLTFQLLQSNPEPPVIASITGNTGGAVSRGCLLTINGQHFVTQGTKLKIIQSGSAVAELQSTDFEEYSDLTIKIRIPGSLATGSTMFEVSTDYGAASASLPVQDYSMKALDVLPPSNYIGGPFRLNKQGSSVNRILFDGLGAAAQEQFEQDGDIVASRVPPGIGAGQATVFVESNVGCYSNPLPFVVANGNSPWGGGIGGSDNIVIPNPPSGTDFSFVSQGVYWKFAEIKPNPTVLELDLETSNPSSDTSIVYGSIRENDNIVGQANGRFTKNGEFLEIELGNSGKKYMGKMDNSYPYFPGTQGPKRYILYPLQPGELGELVQNYLLDDVNPKTFSLGDTLLIEGKYFGQNTYQFNEQQNVLLCKANDLNNCYVIGKFGCPGFGQIPFDCSLWISPTSYKIIVNNNNIPPGSYYLTIGKGFGNYNSNVIAVTVQ